MQSVGVPENRTINFLKKNIIIWLVTSIGLALSVISFSVIKEQIYEQGKIEFNWVAHNRNSLLKQGFEGALEAVKVVRDHIQATEKVEKDNFHLFASSILSRMHGIDSIGLIVQERINSTQTHNMPIKTPLYNNFYLTYVEFGEGNIAVPWYDISSPSLLKTTLKKAQKIGKIAVSERLKLSANNDMHYGVIACLPLYRTKSDISIAPELTGFVVAVLRLDELTHAAISYLEPRGVDILIQDDSTGKDARFLEFYASRLNPAVVFQEDRIQDWLINAKTLLTEVVQMGDRKWSITAVPNKSFRSAEAFEEGPFVVLLSGILLTLLLTIYLLRMKLNFQEHLRMDRLLKDREELFWQMTETVDDVFWALSADKTNFLYVSPALETIWGIKCQELYDNPKLFSHAIHPNDRSQWSEALNNAEQSSHPVEMVYRLTRPDGTQRWIRDNAFPVVNKKGKVYRFVGVAEDITEKRKLQNQEIRNARLASIGILATGVAHEINNPNNAIQISAALYNHVWKDAMEVLREYYHDQGDFSLGGLSFAEEGESLGNLISDIRDNSLRIKAIVGNLKHLGKNDLGELNEDININAALRAAAGVLKSNIHKCTKHWIMELGDDLPMVKGNFQQLEQVFINVMLNALQSLPDSEHGVQIKSVADLTKRFLLIQIIDQGTGIKEKDLLKVTEPFFTTRLETGGTGLGLSISSTIIENHHGSIAFKSSKESGTQVTIQLPMFDRNINA
ncbi:MAG: PAS domain-containing protein [gamma proteobacterium symbiont of Taylorina sp.]|nr:PAS domain-containing protein [gamma proteobacterium symbiont of Taylorina sp.]